MEFIDLILCRNKKQEKSNKANSCNGSKDQSSSKSGYLKQFIAGTSIYFLCINHGVHSAWTSPALPYLSNRTSDFTISEEEGAWIASISAFGIMPGTLLCPFLLDRIGRKHTISASVIPALLSWTIIILASNQASLYIARFISGIASGMAYSAATLYFAEIGAKEIRGILTTLINICSNLGILLVVSIGAVSTYETMNMIMTSLPIFALLSLPLMLKTPYFHLIKNDEKSAVKSLMELRGIHDPELVQTEIKRMKKAVVESRDLEKTSMKEFFARGNRKGLIILFFATAAMYLSGIAAIEAYAEEIFSYSNFALSPKYATIVLGVVRIIAGLLSTLFIDRGRKIMFLVSGTLSAASLAAVGLFYFLDSRPDFDASGIAWLPLVGLVSYLIVSNLGLVSIPAIFMGELFSIKAKGKAIAVGIIFAAAFLFASKFWFQRLKSQFGMHMPFWIFATCCIVCTIFVFWISPETSGKNLEEVQSILKGNKGRKEHIGSENLELGGISN